MSQSTQGKQVKKLKYCFIICLFLYGCSSPDSWYDIEHIYEDNSTLQHSSPVDKTLLPEPKWQEESPLPQAENGRIALSLEQAVVFSLQRNQELRVERYSPLLRGHLSRLSGVLLMQNSLRI